MTYRRLRNSLKRRNEGKKECERRSVFEESGRMDNVGKNEGKGTEVEKETGKGRERPGKRLFRVPLLADVMG